MDTKILQNIKEIKVDTKTIGIKQITVTTVLEGYKVVYTFIDSKQVNMTFLHVDWKVFADNSEENISKEFRPYAPYIVFNFVQWLFKEFSMRKFKTFLFVEEDSYRVRYEYADGRLELFSHGYES